MGEEKEETQMSLREDESDMCPDGPSVKTLILSVCERQWYLNAILSDQFQRTQ